MPIDASIALGVRPPQIESPLNSLAKVLQVQEAQQGQQMNRLKMDEYQRGVEQERAYNMLYQSAVKPDGTIDRAKLYTGAAQGGFGSKIPGLQKGFLETDEKANKVDADKFKLAKERYDYMRSTMGALAQEPTLTKQMVEQAGQALVQQGILPPELYQQAIGNMPDDPQQLRARLTQGLKAQMSPEKVFELFAPKAEKLDNGQQISFRDTNPNSPTFGQDIAGAPVQKMQTPDNKASVGASMANAAAVRATAQATRDAATTQANATREAARYKDDKDREMKLGDDWRAQSKPFKEAADAYKIISATLDKASTSPAATLAAATKFMKQLDPGSVVRESELGMALAATGALDRAANYVNTLKLGKVLTPSQVKDFKDISAKVYQAAQEGQKQVDMNYRRQAEQYQLRPDMVVQDLGQNTPAGGQTVNPQVDELLKKYGGR